MGIITAEKARKLATKQEIPSAIVDHIGKYIEYAALLSDDHVDVDLSDDMGKQISRYRKPLSDLLFVKDYIVRWGDGNSFLSISWKNNRE